MDACPLSEPEHWLDTDDCKFLIKFSESKEGEIISNIFSELYGMECSELETEEDPTMLIRRQARCRLLSGIWDHFFNDPSFYLQDKANAKKSKT